MTVQTEGVGCWVNNGCHVVTKMDDTHWQATAAGMGSHSNFQSIWKFIPLNWHQCDEIWPAVCRLVIKMSLGWCSQKLKENTKGKALLKISFITILVSAPYNSKMSTVSACGVGHTFSFRGAGEYLHIRQQVPIPASFWPGLLPRERGSGWGVKAGLPAPTTPWLPPWTTVWW